MFTIQLFARQPAFTRLGVDSPRFETPREPRPPWPERHIRTPEIGARLTIYNIRNIILDLRQQTVGGRHQKKTGTLAGFRSEGAAGFVLECMAGVVPKAAARGGRPC
jgi:hypothetical protein